MKWRIVRVGKGTIGIPTAEIRRLAMVVAMDYERRRRGERPDHWHWADIALFNEGYAVVPEYHWSVWGPGERHFISMMAAGANVVNTASLRRTHNPAA